MHQHRRVLGRGFWSLCDQGVVSSGNFFSNIFLARAISEHDYGTFAILFGILLLLNNIHAALVTYQISVRGASADDESLRGFVGSGLVSTILLAPFLAIPLAIGCVAVGTPHLIVWAIPAMLLWQMQETVRRALMAKLRFEAAAIGDTISFWGQAAFIFVLAQREQVDLKLVFAAMAGTSLIAMLIQLSQIGFFRLVPQQIPGFVREGWSKGRWLLMNNLLNVVNLQAVSWLVAATHGREQAAQLSAISNILGMTHPVLMGLSSLIVPATAKMHVSEGMRAASRAAMHYAVLGMVLLAPIYLVIAAIPDRVLWTFYKDKYYDCTLLLRLVVLCYVIDFAGQMIMAMLNGLEQSRAVFLAGLSTCTITLVVTVPLVITQGVIGALIGACIGVALRAALGAYFAQRLRHATRPSAVSAALGQPT